MLPKRKSTKGRMGTRVDSGPIRCPGHLKWLRGFTCLNCGDDERIEAAHIRLGTDGGMGVKPGDNWAIPLCSDCHRRQHDAGEATFWGHKLDAKRNEAAHFWLVSPHGKKWRAEHGD